MLATPENCKGLLFSVRTFFGGIDPELDAILFCSPDYRELGCYDTWELQQCLPIFIGVDHYIIKAIASFQRCQDAANAVLSLQKNLDHPLDSKNLTDANRYSQTEQGRQWFVEILNSLLGIAKSAYFAGTLPVIGAWEDFNTKVKAHDFLTWALSKNYEIPEFLQSAFFDQTAETTEAGNPTQQECAEVSSVLDEQSNPAFLPEFEVTNRVAQGSGRSQVRGTVSENPIAMKYIERWRSQNLSNEVIIQKLKNGGASWSVVGCLLFPQKTSIGAAEQAAKRLTGKNQPV